MSVVWSSQIFLDTLFPFTAYKVSLYLPLPSQSLLCRSTLLFLSHFTPIPFSSLISTHIYSVDCNGPDLHSVEFKRSFKRKKAPMNGSKPFRKPSMRCSVLQANRYRGKSAMSLWEAEKHGGLFWLQPRDQTLRCCCWERTDPWEQCKSQRDVSQVTRVDL